MKSTTRTVSVAAMLLVLVLVLAAAWLLLLRPIAPDAVAAPSSRASASTTAAPATPGTRPATGPTPTATTPRGSATGGSRPSAPTPTAKAPAEAPSSARPTTTGAGAASDTTSGSTESTCTAGVPARLVIPALGVDAPFERIGVDTGAPADAQGRQPLGNPTDRTKAGWYAAGPRPGSGTGTVLANGHTYRDGSAIFRESFASRVAVAQRIDVVQRGGGVCSYQVQRVWREVDAKRDYSRIVSSEKLYNFQGPERLFLATCGGSWNSLAQDYDDISLLIATPIDRG